MYSGYMRSGGCTSCGVAPRAASRDQFSRSYYNGFDRYQSNNSYGRRNYNVDNYLNNMSQSYVNYSRRIMTPTKNYSSSYSPNSYYSPNRYTGGCKECSSSPSQIRYRNYPRLNTENSLLRSANNLKYNMNRDLFNVRNNNDNLRNYEDNDNDNYTFKSSYVIPNNYKNRDNNRFNRYQSPNTNNIRRNLLNTRYGNYNTNIEKNNNDRFNRLNYSVYNNQYITNNLSNNTNSRIYPSNNLFNSVSINNDYKQFLENNMNRYNYKKNPTNTNNNYLNKNISSEKIEEYNSPIPGFDYRRRNLDLSKRRYDYLRDNNEQEKNQLETPKFESEIFVNLTQYNYKRKLIEYIDSRKTFFVFVFGSQDYTGQSWCSDCNIAKPIVEQGKRLIENRKYEKKVYFLSIPIDKIYKEDFRDDPYIQLERVPTLILFENGIEKGRLVENDLFSYQSVRDFILQIYEQGMRRQYYYDRRNYY